jgi:hypothetical protein
MKRKALAFAFLVLLFLEPKNAYAFERIFEVQGGSNKVRLVDRIVLCSSFFEVNPRTVRLFLTKAFPTTKLPKIFSGAVTPASEEDKFTVYLYLGRDKLSSQLETCMNSFPADIKKPTEMAKATHKMLGTRPLFMRSIWNDLGPAGLTNITKHLHGDGYAAGFFATSIEYDIAIEEAVGAAFGLPVGYCSENEACKVFGR